MAPSQRDMHIVTRLLQQVQEGHGQAWDELMPLVYDELYALAEHKLRFERNDHTLTPTALVHEAYLKLVDQNRVHWQSRSHFFAIAAQAMRRILVNYAARRKTAKRGGGTPQIAFSETLVQRVGLFTDRQAEEVLALNEALNRLEAFSERACRVVEYRFFGGLTYEEVGQVMGLSSITVRRAWNTARAWLRREMKLGG